MAEPLIFELSSPGRRGTVWPACDVPQQPLETLLPAARRAQPPRLPEVSELDVVRHFTRLSQMNYAIDTTFVPLGSCSMKYNPKVNDRIASLPGFAQLHPYQPAETCQGALEVLYRLERGLAEVTGMADCSLQPSAGAQGELTGLKIVRAYHAAQGHPRKVVLIPDSAHGTNPASAALSGYTVREIKSGRNGLVDVAALREAMHGDVACLMLTNPNTLGLFEREILQITAILHEHDALVYLDGANMNAMLGLVKPGTMGVDIIQLNLHKTFSTPHGGGGPGAGPVAVVQKLVPFLPTPRIERQGDRYVWNDRHPQSIGRVRSFYGNAGILIRAWAYLVAHGREGLVKIGRMAVMNANYLRARLAPHVELPYGRTCMHEFVASLAALKPAGVTTLDVAKRLLDYGFYAPTIYFPLIVSEAMMIEPTESESKETLDAFADALIAIIDEARRDPELVRTSPHATAVRRLDEVQAARQLDLRWQPAPGEKASR
ncbi:MAG: aminomethyl-transferring glycine dehydrogenase subunit GcvPB [Candidatus Omnitrophica bacterium]|nr:aminomethyl-transferring glycine dehydrogenase subunit GcvPB [Candidatus Omnitrophota bacterium]